MARGKKADTNIVSGSDSNVSYENATVKQTVRFISPVAYLYVDKYGIQFRHGEYATAKDEEIVYLKTLANVKVAE
jgi:hypothetical protein